jgi:glycosyltransferase involved in cell wall biosynthesis
MADRVRVCVILEGSYPYITGGVSSWMHELINQIPEVDFVIYSISPKAEQELRYKLPANVVEHKDIVLSAMKRSTHRAKGRPRLFELLRDFHSRIDAGALEDFAKIAELMPPGYFPHRDSFTTDVGWEMISQGNQLNNPIYPFSDYFWAWKSAHDMMFTVIGTEAPEADLYHAISTGYAGLAAVMAKLRTGKPLLLTEHGLYHKEREMEIRRVRYIRGYQRDMWIKTYNGLSRLAYQHADMTIALFEYNRRMQIALGAHENRTKVIANGIDVERFSSVKRVRREGFHVGLIGRVVPIKDIKTFISMSRIIRDRYPDAEFHCIGPTDEDPAYFEDCKTMVKSFRLEECFHFTGRANVLEYYAFLDVLLLTSVREAQPLVILEAYAAGVPVVSTNVGNVPELLDYDDRFLSPSKDAQKLAGAVVYIREHPDEMRDIVEQNLRKTESFYDRKSVFRSYLEIYESLGGVKQWQE